jgi:hypothetical protein
MINFIEQELKPHLAKNGVLYILFDPISYSDLGESKNFAVPLNNRKKILADYKANRVYSPLYLESIELFRKYYIHRGESIKLVYSDEYEADDYVEPLLDIFEDEWKNDDKPKSIAMISTDLDFCRYIHRDPKRRIELINEGFQNPYTVKQFEDIFQFKPTIAANTVYRALFGDKSDCIQGALFIKKAKFNMNVKVLARDYIQMISKSDMTLNDVINQFKTAKFLDINNRVDKSVFDLLFLAMSIVDLKTPILEKFYTNIRVIRTPLEGRRILNYIHCNPIQEKLNEVVHQAIFGIEFKNQFGRA